MKKKADRLESCIIESLNKFGEVKSTEDVCVFPHLGGVILNKHSAIKGDGYCRVGIIAE